MRTPCTVLRIFDIFSFFETLLIYGGNIVYNKSTKTIIMQQNGGTAIKIVCVSDRFTSAHNGNAVA